MGSTGMVSGSQFVAGAVVAGKYRLLKPLGEGAMGAVWAAQNEATFAQVALKLIVRPGQELRQRLLREARACGTIRHRNVVQIYDVGETAEGDPFLVMELLQGEPLSDALARKRRLSVEEASRIGRDIARGLAAAHEKGIVHRDLKPANVFLHNEPGEDAAVVKVLDFGVSKNLGVNDGLSTVAGGTVGSPMYMSPEQANAERDVDARTDLWSLGVLMFEMLVGERPFSGESASVMVAIREGEIPTVSRRLRRIDPGLDRVVSGCLTRARDARLGPAADIARLLEPFSGQLGSGSRAPLPSLMDIEGASEAPSASSGSSSGRGLLTRSGSSGDPPRSSAPRLHPDRASASGHGSGGSALIDEDDEGATRPISAQLLAPMVPSAPPSRPSATAHAPADVPYGVTEHGTVRIAPDELETALRQREERQAVSAGLNPPGGTLPMLPALPALVPASPAVSSSTAPMLTGASPPAPPQAPPVFGAPPPAPRRAAHPAVVVGAGAGLGASVIALAAFFLLRGPPPAPDTGGSATASTAAATSSSAAATTAVTADPPAPSVAASTEPAPSATAASATGSSTGTARPPAAPKALAPKPTTSAPPKSTTGPKPTPTTKSTAAKPATTAKGAPTTKPTGTKPCNKPGAQCNKWNPGGL